MSSTSLAFEFPSTTLTIPFPTGTTTAPGWIRGQFPSSLTITNNTLAEGLIADVPFYSVGVLAIGVATFFFVMNRIQKHIFYALLATFLAFIAAIIDFGQLVIISRGVFTGTVFPLRIARELGYAVSFGMRFFFFWQFVAMPPRGEVPILPTPGPGPGRGNRKSFVMEDEFHSGSWGRWGLIGILTKYALLLGAITIGVTQAIWRLGFAFGLIRFTSVYRVDAIMQIIMSALFLLKLVGNSYISPLMPRWKTIRDYLPVVAAISIGLGVGIGNLMCMRFSESPLGRFLQSIELYILILYVLISTFYKMPVRASVLIDALDRKRTRDNSSFVGINMGNSMRGSTFRVTPPTVSTPQLQSQTTRELDAAGVNGMPTRLLGPDTGRRQSTAERLATWLQNRLSGRPTDKEQRSLRRDEESGQMESYDYTDEKKRSVESDASSIQPVNEPDYGWRDAMYANIRAPPTGTTTAVNDTPRFDGVPGPSEPPTSSQIRESTIATSYTPAKSYAPAESKPVGPRATSVPTIYSPIVSEAFSPIIAASLAPVNPLSIRSLPSNPRPRPRETISSSDSTPFVPEPAPVRMPSPVLAESPYGASFRITREYGSPSLLFAPNPSTQLDPRRQMTNPGDESPIYGLDGIIQSLGGDLLPDEELRSQSGSLMRRDSATYSPGAASFRQKQVDLDRSVADLQRFASIRSRSSPRLLYALSDGANPSNPSLAQESTSFRSDFTLRDFPSPPSAILDYSGFPPRNPVVTRPREVDLDDIRFTLTPPRMPAAAADGRQMSFPSTTRGSDIFQLQSRVVETPNKTQWDVTSFIGGSGSKTPLSAAIIRPDSQGRPLSYVRNQLRRDTIDTQRLSMVIESFSNGTSTPDYLDDEGEGSVRGARLIDVRRASSLSRARIVEGPLSATPSSVNSTNPQTEAEPPAPMLTAAERLAAFRARPPLKTTLPSSPRPAYRTGSPPIQERSAIEEPALMVPETQAQQVLQPQPSISAIQAQQNSPETQQLVFPQPAAIPPVTRINNMLTPPRGLRSLRIGSPVGQSQNETALFSDAFERPRPAPLVLGSGRAI
ncbi:hypothetical protein RHS04_04624 [Rhizoctonia solani]|uniref:Uncharacterized protein n=1 Tax=Rhizoctonia solani TaxID=456999 RepID=A0A8H7LKQ4_9AGAM|nr:hypothetical protein RHS04_04624 [Rhizoctonia solani]